MTKAIRFHQTGGSDVLQYEDITLAPPAAGEVRLRHTAIGVNFIDTYHRSGLYAVPLPSGLGKEVAGVVEALGDGVTGLKVGDRVATASAPLGVELTSVPVDVPLGPSLVFVPPADAASSAVHSTPSLHSRVRRLPLRSARRCASLISGQCSSTRACAGSASPASCTNLCSASPSPSRS